MFKIEIISVGKESSSPLQKAMETYVKRLKNRAKIFFQYAKNDQMLMKLTEKSSSLILLDEKGTTFSSLEFSKFLFSHFEQYGTKCTFVLGANVGLPEELKEKKHFLFSLSSLTFPYELARLVLTEQIYRAFQIEANTAYHKE